LSIFKKTHFLLQLYRFAASKKELLLGTNFPLMNVSSSSVEHFASASQTSTLDIVALVSVIFSTLLIFALNFYLYYSRHQRVIERKNVANIYAISSFGLIWIWSTLIVNWHIPKISKAMLSFRCSIWSLWLQYMFGQTPWMGFIAFRLHGFYMKYKLSESSRVSKFIRNLTIFILFFVPMFAICVIGEFHNVSNSTKKDEVCSVVPTEWKFLIFSSVFLNFIVIGVLVLMVKNTQTVNNAFAWYDETHHFLRGVIVAFLILLLGTFIRLGEYTSSVAGRFGFMCLIIFCVIYFYLTIVWRAVRINYQTSTLYVTTFEELRQDVDAMQFFLEWMKKYAKKKTLFQYNFDKQTSNDSVTPSDIANAYIMIEQYLLCNQHAEELSNNDPKLAELMRNAFDLKSQIVNEYMNEEEEQSFLPVPENISLIGTEDDIRFERTRDWIVETFRSHYWPEFSLDQIHGLACYSRLILQETADERNSILLQ